MGKKPMLVPTITALAAANGLVPQHRYTLFRRMVSTVDKYPLSMASWAVNLEHDGAFRRWHRDPNMIGMSVAGMSDREHADVMSYARSHGAMHITRKRKFEDFMHGGLLDKILNMPDDLNDVTYFENEIVVVGEIPMIEKALRWLRRYPARRYTCYVRDMRLSDIRQAVSHTNNRIVPNTSDRGGYFVSTDDSAALFPIWLRG